MSRARNRIVAITAAMPLFIAGGPVLSVANAVDGPVTQATMVSTLGDYRVGPRAGFRGDVDRGVNGTTAVLRLDLSPSAVINTVQVRVDLGKPFSVYQHFHTADGIAVYKDANDNGRLDEAEHTAGPVTQPNYGVTGDGNAAIVTLTGDAAKATGASDYLITVHPNAVALADRPVTFTVPANGIKTSSGDLPASPFSTTDVVIDSLAPALIPATNFTPVNRPPVTFCPPGSAVGACGNDGYLVYRGATPTEDGAKIAFFNVAGDVSDAALLIASPAGENTAAVPALYSLNAIQASEADKIELSIGNGTGRDSSVAGSKALNNQLSDDVTVAQWDLMGNLASQQLNNSNPCLEGSANCTVEPLRGNDVTGVRSTYSLTVFNNINAEPGSNPSAHLVRGSVSSEDSGRPANRTQATAGQIRQVAVLHRLSDQDTSLFAGAQAWSNAMTPSSTATNIESFVNAANDAQYPSPSRVRATTVLVDKTGNASAPVNSAVRYRDLVKPNFTGASLLDLDASNGPSTGDQYRITFDDPINPTTVTAANVNTRIDPDSSTGAGLCGPTTPLDQPCPNWGSNPTVAWSSDARVLTITLGTEGSPCPGNEAQCRFAAAGDEVQAEAPVVDLAGNKIGNSPFIVQNPFVLAHKATTVDAAALSAPAVFGTGRDGILEAVDIQFSGPITKSTITDASDAEKFTVSVPGGSTLVASAVGLGGGSTATTVRVSFTPPTEEWALWGTAATPAVRLTDGTIVKSGNQFIPAFVITGADGAPPVPLSFRTQDTAPGDGKIDKVLVKYSEPVTAGAENPCGYTVTGYGDSAYVPAGASSAPSSTCPGSGNPVQYRNKPEAVTGAPDTIALTLKVGTVSDTAATPLVSFNAANQVPPYGPGSTGANGTSAPECNVNASLVLPSTPNCPVVDASGNGLPVFSGVSQDGAAPAIVGRNTADTDADGHLDAINVVYSESLNSAQSAQYVVTEPAYTIDRVSQSGDTTMLVKLFPSTTAPGGDTGEKPKIQALGGTTDTSENVNATPADAAGVVTTDKAGPAIMGACVSSTVPAETPAAEKTARLGTCGEGPGDKVTIRFSEAVDGASSAAADYAVQQPAGTAKTVGSAAAPTNAADGKSGTVVLTMAASNNLNPILDAFVKLTGTGVITDIATPTKNPSAQTALITAWAPPTVTIDVTCPVAATPGHCSADYVDTGAEGSGGVVGWRLVDSAVAPPIPAAGDFSLTQPTRYPAEGVITEGDHKLWLRGKDIFDRISPEVSEAVAVYKTPKILNVQMVDSTPRASGTWSRTTTVMDGDAILIGADAYGTDAAQWASNSQPTGGGCLAQHMSADLRALTGRSTDGTVKPSKCDLKTTTEQPYRQMQFPVVRAAGTTRYPVGTVLKVTDSEPGSMIVDGPGGTLRRRPFISVGARRSWMISDASVIKVPTTLMNAIPRTTSIKYRNGALLRSSTGYYYMYEGLKRPVSAAQLSAWRMSTSTAYRPTTGELKLIPTGSRITGSAHPAGTWIRYSDGRIYQVVRNTNGIAVRRQLASSSALRTLVPSSQIYPANSNDSQLAVDTWLRGYRDGTLLKLGDGTFAVVARGSLRNFANPATFNTLGFATSNALSANGAAMPRVKGQAYRLGTSIDRYLISTVVIKVTNKAGGIATATVLPASNGIFGVGTLDAVPLGWDTTR